jgi:hypothetical protein
VGELRSLELERQIILLVIRPGPSIALGIPSLEAPRPAAVPDLPLAIGVGRGTGYVTPCLTQAAFLPGGRVLSCSRNPRHPVGPLGSHLLLGFWIRLGR